MAFNDQYIWHEKSCIDKRSKSVCHDLHTFIFNDYHPNWPLNENVPTEEPPPPPPPPPPQIFYPKIGENRYPIYVSTLFGSKVMSASTVAAILEICKLGTF